MRVSENELEALVCRACLGQGWSHGLAVEAGQAVSWLAGRGIDGGAVVLDALAAPPRPAELCAASEGWHFDRQPVIAAGPSAFDLLETKPEGSLTLTEATPEALLLGYAGRAAARYHASYTLTLVAGLAKVSATGLDLDRSSGADQIEITRQGAPLASAEPRPDLEIATETWEQLQTLAQKSYVPATEASRRSGAGAGLTDND